MSENYDGEQRQARLDALRSMLPDGQPSSIPAPTAAGGQTRASVAARGGAMGRPRLLWGILAGSTILLILAVVGAAYIMTGPAMRSKSAAPGGQGVLAIYPRQDNLFCPQDIAWSPDGKELAVIGYASNCPDANPTLYTYASGLINLYDTTHGKLITQIHPDSVIVHDPNIRLFPFLTPSPGAGAPQAPVLTYQRLLWSPDGQRIGVTFSLTEWTSSTQSSNVIGVFTQNLATSRQEVHTHVVGAGDSSVTIWDLTTGALVAQTSAKSALPWGIAAALQYQWSDQGQLLPVGALSASTLIPTADAASKRFSVWQLGIASRPSHGQIAADVWKTMITQWSPDGRYILTSLYAVGYLFQPDESTLPETSLASLGVAGAPRMSTPDSGLRQIYRNMEKDSSLASGQLVAWTDNGRFLAARAQSSAQIVTARARAVRLYDCATGRLVGTLTPRANSFYAVDTQGSDVLLWSASGARVASLYGDIGEIDLWQAPAGA